MAVTLRGTYVGAPSTSHSIGLGTGTAGTDIFVAVSAAAGMPTATSPWVREVYGVHTTAGAVYRLPAASNTGSITTLDLTLSGARQCAAVIWEDSVDTGVAISIVTSNQGFTESASLTTGPFTASARDAHVLVVCAAGGTATVAQAATAYSDSFTSVGQSTPTTAADEDAVAYVAALEPGGALTSESIDVTFASSWYKVSEHFLISYDQSAGPSETATSLVLSASPASPDEETPVSLIATATPSGATGTVTFTEGATTLGSVALTSGVATLSGQIFTPGTHNLTADLDGTDGVYADSTDDLALSVSAAAGDGVVGEQILVYGDLRSATAGPYLT